MAFIRKTPADDIGQKIVTDLSFTFGTDLFINYEPSLDLTKSYVVLYDTPSGGQQNTKGKTRENRTIFLVSNGAVGDDETAVNNAQKVLNSLHLSDAFTTAENTTYYSVFALSGVYSLGLDKNKRPVYGLSLEINRAY